MANVFDVSKIQSSISKTKGLEGISFGFSQPSIWFSTGCYALNWMLTKDFDRGFPLDGKINMLAGDSGAGKSYICSGNMVRDALSKGVSVILFDTEDRLDEQWMMNMGIDPSCFGKTLIRIHTNRIEEVMKTISMIASNYRDQYGNTPKDDQPGLLFVIDSLGALFPSDEIDRHSEGELSMTDGMRDAGAKTKLMNSILTNIASTKMGCILTNHVYCATDQYSDDKIPGGKKAVFLSTQILQMNKYKLKDKDVERVKIVGDESAEDVDEEDSKDGSEVVGIRSSCKVYKSNWNQPFTKIEIQIPYDTGMNPYSGLFDLFCDLSYNGKKCLSKDGKMYVYTNPKGEEVFKKFRKQITNEDWNMMMKEYVAFQEANDPRSKKVDK